MKALYIAYYTILRNMRDYGNLSLMLALPIVLILILGTALSGSFKIENIDPVKVILVNEDKGQISEAFELFLDNKDVKEIMKTEKSEDLNEAIDKVKKREAAVLIHMERDFAEDIASGGKGEIKVYNSDLSIFKASLVQNVIDSFIQSVNAGYAYAKIGSNRNHFDFSENIEEEAINIEGKIPRALDYYAVSMLIMTMMYGTTYGCSAMSEEQFYNTEIRLKAAPVASHYIYTGKVVGTILTLMIDGAIIILFTKYVYSVNWGNHIFAILFTCLSLSIMASGLGVVSFMLIGNENKTQALLMVLVPIFTFLGGGYIPTQYMSPIMEKLGSISPNYIARKIMFNIIFDGSPIEVKNYLSILWMASISFFALSAVKGRRDLA